LIKFPATRYTVANPVNLNLESGDPMKKAFIQTYGCQMNEHDTLRMAGLLVAEGYAMTEEPKEADLVLVNTCSVRHNPENKVYSQLGRWRDMKINKPDLIIGVGGCVAQQEGEAIPFEASCDATRLSGSSVWDLCLFGRAVEHQPDIHLAAFSNYRLGSSANAGRQRFGR